MSRMKQYLSRALSFLLGAVFVLLLLVIVVTVYDGKRPCPLLFRVQRHAGRFGQYGADPAGRCLYSG